VISPKNRPFGGEIPAGFQQEGSFLNGQQIP
jgi:hypothetical protein